MVKWAFRERVAERNAGGAKAGPKDKAAKQPTAEPTAAKLQALRVKRLEELKTGTVQKAPVTVLDAVAEVFNAGPRRGQKKVQLVDDIVVEAKGLSGIAKEVVDSLQNEVFPATTPLPTPQASLQALLATSAPFASD